MIDKPDQTAGTKVLGDQYKRGRFYYVRFKDQASNEWSIAQCVPTKLLERGFHTIRGLVNWDNASLVVIGPVPNPPLLSAFPRQAPAITKLQSWLDPNDGNESA